jgi:hypothetical protein
MYIYTLTKGEIRGIYKRRDTELVFELFLLMHTNQGRVIGSSQVQEKKKEGKRERERERKYSKWFHGVVIREKSRLVYLDKSHGIEGRFSLDHLGGNRHLLR